MPTAARPLFLNNPIRWTKWFAYTHPTWFWSLFFPINAIGALVWAPPLQRYFGVIHPAPIPRSYPIPTGPRKKLTGYGDDTEES